MINPVQHSTVVVGMSGGVDSSVAAALLLEQGYNVIGVTMKTYETGGAGGSETSCCGLDASDDARMVAVKLGIPHYVADFTREFGRSVIDNFVDEYLRGRTPNPCVICNRSIKWGELLRMAESLGAGRIATGHYARVWFDEESGSYALGRPADRNKDQTYALWALGQEALGKTIFPLGELTKPEVRALAVKYGLKTATKEESFEICFVADDDYGKFLRNRVGGLDDRYAGGDLLRGGRVVGKHRGFPYYTIGQRGGIGAHGERMYVTGIDPAANSITIGPAGDILRNTLIARDVNVIGAPLPPHPVRVQAQVRYKDTPAPATLDSEADGSIRIVFDEPKRAITPGQSVVFYDGDRLVGGGVIERSEP